MIGALRALGVTVDGDHTELAVSGRIGPSPDARVDCGLAGTVLRFVPPVAALGTETVVFDGDEQARARPIAPLLDALRGLGVDIDGDGLPFSVRGGGTVAGGTVEIDASGSSQFVSGLLLSGAAFTDGLTVVHTGESVPSAPHVAMTVAMLRDAGVDVDDTQTNRWRVSPGPIAARHWIIEPDLSNAVPFLAAAVVTGGNVRIAGWPQVSTQPADAILAILEKLGSIVRHSSSYLEVQGADDLRRLRRRPARCRRADTVGGGAGRAGLTRFDVTADRDRPPARPRDRPAGGAERRDQRPRRAMRRDARRSGHHRAAAARRPVAVLRRPPDGDSGCDRRSAGAGRRGRGHRHHRQDTAGLPADVGRHAGRPGRDLTGRDYDESDVRVRPGRGSRPRTKTRPDHADAEEGMVVTVDRGRWGCVLGGDPDRLVTAMRARELGRTPIVVGDDVGVVGDLSGRTDTLARIVRRGDRRTVLRRTADDTDPTERVVVANADQLLIVVALADPPPRTGFVERALIAAYAGGLTPILCLTKADLAPPEPFAAQFADLDLTIATAGRDDPLDAVAPLLVGKVTVLLGHSGVGKSTLVNRLVPDADRAIGEVSGVGKGRHTSTQSVALPLEGAVGSSTPPASGRSGWPTSRPTTCCWRSPTWPRRSRTVRAAAATWARPPTPNARWTR